MPLTPSYWRSWRNLIALLLFVATVGCNSTNRGGQAKALDPLFGAPPGPSATRPPTGNASAAPLPNSSVSNAALVHGQQPPPYGTVGQPGNPAYPQPPYPSQPNNVPLNGYGAPPPPAWNQPAPNPQYNQPPNPAWNQPPPPNYGNPPPPVNLASVTPVSNNPMPLQPGQRVASYDQAQAYLGSLGVKWQRLESGVDGEWKFTCSIPNRQNPALSRTYEGRALNYLAAVQAVLDQVDQDRR